MEIFFSMVLGSVFLILYCSIMCFLKMCLIMLMMYLVLVFVSFMIGEDLSMVLNFLSFGMVKSFWVYFCVVVVVEVVVLVVEGVVLVGLVFGGLSDGVVVVSFFVLFFVLVCFWVIIGILEMLKELLNIDLLLDVMYMMSWCLKYGRENMLLFLMNFVVNLFFLCIRLRLSVV